MTTRSGHGFKISFCTRQFNSSAIWSVFSDRVRHCVNPSKSLELLAGPAKHVAVEGEVSDADAGARSCRTPEINAGQARRAGSQATGSRLALPAMYLAA